jgi:PGDH: phosphoglycerate dehydrogenase
VILLMPKYWMRQKNWKS